MSITSPSNNRIKALVKLQEKSSERKEKKLFVVEGQREITQALAAGYTCETLFVCPELVRTKQPETSCELIDVSKTVFSKIAYRENSDGLLGVFRQSTKTLDEIKLGKIPLVLILEAVEKPGNLGAILRTADAAGVDAVIVCDPKTDIFNPNVIRSSLGAVFTNQLVVTSNAEVMEWLIKMKIIPYAAALSGEKKHYEANFNAPAAIVMGTEAEGLSDFWLTKCEQIKIPMHGKIDSLNVSASCAVIVFEALRQRAR
jgi:RNA methyltransferase, TrmH family